MACRSGCRSGDHASWGECARAAGIQIDKHGLKHSSIEKRKDATLDRYQALRAAGIQPDSPLKYDVDKAERANT